MSDDEKKPVNETATPKTSDGSGEFSAHPKGSGQQWSEKSMFPKGGGGKDEASVQPKTVTPETDTIIPPANRD